MSASFFIFDAVKTSWIYSLVRYLKKVYFKNDKRVAAYVVCVIIATGFWFLNALSKTYTVDLVIPVKYVNLPDNKTLSTQLPDKFDLKVRAHGFTILRHQISAVFMPVEFNVNDMTDNRMLEKRRNSFAFPTRQFLPDLAYQLSSELEILSMNPDTLFFKFDKMGQKKVKIQPVLKVNLKKQYQISGEITTQPELIAVDGPQSVLDTLKWIMTEPLKFNLVDKTIQTEAVLQKIDETYFETAKVNVTIPVEEFTEAQLPVQVELTDAPDNLNIKLFPSKVKVTFQVGLSRFKDIQTQDFKLLVSYSDIKEGNQRLKIKLESSPDFLYDLKVTPEEIEYLIEN